MSAGVGVWKDALLKAARIPARRAGVAAPAQVSSSAAAPPILSLVRQVFFPAAGVRRTRVFFVAADSGTRVFAVCKQVGEALAEMSGATVAIMEASRLSADASVVKRRPGNGGEADWWRHDSCQIAENVWRVPSTLMSARCYPAGSEGRGAAESGDPPFDYLLFAAVVTDSETPEFCGACDGAVLVLTANQSRKETALRACEHLLQCNAELLGTVLDGRTFPVPEAIYQRL